MDESQSNYVECKRGKNDHILCHSTYTKFHQMQTIIFYNIRNGSVVSWRLSGREGEMGIPKGTKNLLGDGSFHYLDCGSIFSDVNMSKLQNIYIRDSAYVDNTARKDCLKTIHLAFIFIGRGYIF